MDSILKTFHLEQPDSLKRFLTMLFGIVVLLAVNPVLAKMGLPPVNDNQIGAAAMVLTSFILQSGMRAVAKAKAEAAAEAAKVQSVEDAAKVIGEVK